MISVNGVSFSYIVKEKQRPVLKNISACFRHGEHVTLIGRNGSGKSTVARLLNALLVPDEGCVTVDGIDTHIEENKWKIRQRVGMVFQNPDNQLIATSVEEDVAFGPENLGLPPAVIRERVEEALELVGLINLRHREPHTLSGGQKQRVAVAGVIAMRPKYVVMDEPTAMLDPRGRDEILATVSDLKEKGMGIVFITHFMEEAVHCDRVMVLEGGRIVFEGVPREVFSRVNQLKAMQLDVPPVTALSHELRQEGVPLPVDVLSVQEMVEALCPLLK